MTETDVEDAQTDAQTDEEMEMPMDVEMQDGPQRMLTLEIPLDERDAVALDNLELPEGMDIETAIARQVRSQVEDIIHQLYKQAKYQQ